MSKSAEHTVDVGPTPFFVPPLVGGDAEFGGNGPRVNTRVELYIRDGHELWVRIFMDAMETSSDWTHASGSADYFLYRHPTLIREVRSPRVGNHFYLDINTEPDFFSFEPGGVPYSRLEYVGDTDTDEAGIYTGVRVFLHPVRLLVDA